MRTNWNRAKVEDIAADSKFALATGPFGSSISSKFFVSSGVPVIRGSNLSQEVGVRLLDDGLAFLNDEKAAEFERSQVKKGDLIFTCWGTIDQVGLIDKRAKFERYIVSNKQMKFTPHPDRADSLYLYYYFSSPKIRDTILSCGIGSSVPGFNLGQLKGMEVLLPPLDEQKEIATILGSFDDKIELNRKTNETLEETARAIFKSWFVDFDPVRAKMDGRQPVGMDAETASLFPSEFEDSVLGNIPKGWAAVELKEIVEINPKRSLKKGAIATYLDMKNTPTKGHRPLDTWPREFKSGTRFVNGDTLIARITPCLENGKTAFVDFLDDDEIGWGSTEYIVLRPFTPLPTYFAYFLARSEDFRLHAIQNMTGSSGRQRVPVDCLESYPFVSPTEKVAEAFKRAIDPIMQLISARDCESKSLAEIRDTLLPRLLSGEIRVGAGSPHSAHLATRSTLEEATA